MIKFNLIVTVKTSSKTGRNVETVFDLLIKYLLAKMKIN